MLFEEPLKFEIHGAGWSILLYLGLTLSKSERDVKSQLIVGLLSEYYLWEMPVDQPFL